jgi:hypothetical protein
MQGKSRSDKVGKECSKEGKKRIACRILVGMAKGKGPIARPRHR